METLLSIGINRFSFMLTMRYDILKWNIFLSFRSFNQEKGNREEGNSTPRDSKKETKHGETKQRG